MIKHLRFGMVGGGNNGNIGNSHRRGAGMDNLAILSAGAFTRNQERNLEDGLFWNVPEDRIYANYEDMAKAESQREDGIDFVSIVTPNHTHYAVAKCFLEHGINVVCEKPFTLSVSEAEELKDIASEKKIHIAIPYTYAHYPIMREFRNIVTSGAIGKIIDVIALYPQDWMIIGLNSGEKNFSNWASNPKLSGPSNVTGAMGTHLYYLVESMTGLKIKKVLSHFSYYPEDTPLETSARIVMELEDNVHGLCWTSNVAIGHDCTIHLKVFGEKGAVEWSHEDMTHIKLSMLGEPVQTLSANRDYLGAESLAMSRIPAGHPEGFYEAFANIYKEFCRHLLDKKKGIEKEPSEYFYPKAEDGVGGVRFVQACVDSQARGNTWIKLSDVK